MKSSNCAGFCMRTTLIPICFLMLSCVGMKVENQLRPPFNGMNCNLVNPPTAAGDSGNPSEGYLEKVFPRHTVIPRDYTGCQYVWLKNANKFTLERATYFEDGKLRFYWRLEDGGLPPLLCEYRDETLITKSAACRSMGNFDPERSYPAGCLENFTRTGKFGADCRD